MCLPLWLQVGGSARALLVPRMGEGMNWPAFSRCSVVLKEWQVQGHFPLMLQQRFQQQTRAPLSRTSTPCR
jgi:hypothetical protein